MLRKSIDFVDGQGQLFEIGEGIECSVGQSFDSVVIEFQDAQVTQRSQEAPITSTAAAAAAAAATQGVQMVLRSVEERQRRSGAISGCSLFIVSAAAAASAGRETQVNGEIGESIATDVEHLERCEVAQ